MKYFAHPGTQKWLQDTEFTVVFWNRLAHFTEEAQRVWLQNLFVLLHSPLVGNR